MSAPANCRLVGRWWIVEADIWDQAYLDLSRPATVTITDNGRGEIAFGALLARPAEVNDDGSIAIEFAYHNGDEAVLKSKPDTSSTAC
jgi:hypothetical protein